MTTMKKESPWKGQRLSPNGPKFKNTHIPAGAQDNGTHITTTPGLTPETIRKAQQTTALHAKNSEDLTNLLSALGIPLAPQTETEPPRSQAAQNVLADREAGLTYQQISEKRNISNYLIARIVKGEL